MSALNRTVCRPKGTLRRLMSGAFAAAAVSVGGMPDRPVCGQTIVVEGGAGQTNSTPATYDSIDVSGTDGSGNPSTYNANAALTLNGQLIARDYGVFNANADVSIGSGALALSDGIINLNSGTFSAPTIIVLGSVNQVGGNYATGVLELYNGAALTYGAGDSITSEVRLDSGASLSLGRDLSVTENITLDGASTSLDAAGHAITTGLSLSVTNGATLTLNQNLTVGGQLSVSSGGSIDRTTGTISAAYFTVDNAALDLLVGDTFEGRSRVAYGGVVNGQAGSSLGALFAYGTNGSGDHATFNVNGDVTLADYGFALDGGIINLNSGTLSAQWLFCEGVGSVTQSGGNYATTRLGLSTGAALTYNAGDSISDVSLYSGAVLTLAKDLAISGRIAVDGAATTLDFADYNYAASSLTLSNSAALTYGTGDIITGDVSISDGATLTLAKDLAISDWLVVDGAATSFDSAGHHYAASFLTLSNGATLTFGSGDSITRDVSISSGATLTLTNDLAISGGLVVDGAATSLVSAGSNYAASSLNLSNGAALTFGGGDSITSDVSISNGATLTLTKDLALSSKFFLSSGGSIDRTSETISAAYFTVDNATFDLLTGDTFAPDYSSSVVNGGVVNASAGSSLGYLQAYGTNGNGDRATFNVNGDVTLAGAQAAYGGIINLNSGTLSGALTLFFYGAGSVNQAGGHYATEILGLSDGATLTYGTGDSIARHVSLSNGAALTLAKDLAIYGDLAIGDATTSLDSAGYNYAASSLTLYSNAALTYGIGDSITGDVDISDGATLTLAKDLVLDSTLSLSSGGSLVRSSETISALGFVVDNATLDLLAGDTFDAGSVSDVANGSVVNAPAGSSLGALWVYGTNGSGDRAMFNINGDVTIADYGIAAYGGIVNLNSGTVSAQQLLFAGAGSANQAGGHYATASLELFEGAALTYGTGDSITSDVRISDGATLTLAKDLIISGALAVDGATTSLDSAGHAISADTLGVSNGATLTLDQNLTLTSGLFLESGGSIARTTETISAQKFNVDNATLDLLAGDTFSPSSTSYVSHGGVVNAPAGTAIGSLEVSGTNISGDRATLNVNGDTTIAGYASAFSGGIINLTSGTLSAQRLFFDGVGSVSQAGGHYATASLELYDGASLAYSTGDSIDSLFVDGAGSLLSAQSPLELLGLSLSNGGILYLSAFTGSGTVSNWALRLSGNNQSFLENLITDGFITGSSGPLMVTYDGGSNATFVTFTAVPEPSTYAMALVGIACGGWQMWRRRRAV